MKYYISIILFAMVILSSVPVFADVAPIRPRVENECGVSRSFNVEQCVEQCKNSYDSNLVYICSRRNGEITLSRILDSSLSMQQEWSRSDMAKASLVCRELKKYGESQTIPELKKMIKRFVSGRKLDCSRLASDKQNCEMCNFQEFTSLCFQHFFQDRCIEGCEVTQKCVDMFKIQQYTW